MDCDYACFPGPSAETMRMHAPNSVDLVFIDGDHTKEGG